MKEYFKDLWYWYSNAFFAVLAFISVIFTIIVLFIWGAGNTMKYNCNLEHRPDWYTTTMIADDTYAYNPEGFCNMLKQKMKERTK